jgi:adenosyl cobinamide kinase/adenosyl cobinamide phosphate guanylyltransferase
MKIFLIIAAILIIAGSIFADYKWRHWIARHRRDRNE